MSGPCRHPWTLALFTAAALVACVAPGGERQGAPAADAQPRAAAGATPVRAVSITVDDLPATQSRSLAEMSRITRELLGGFARFGVVATGFVNETKLDDVPGEESARAALLEAWLAAGHDLGNHTYSHLRFYDASLADMQADVVRGERVTRELMERRGGRPRYVRHPTLNTGRTLRAKEAFEGFLADHGYAVAPVTIDNDEYLYAAAYARAAARGDTAAMLRLGADYVRYMEEIFDFYERLSGEVLGREPAQVLLLHANALNADHAEPLLRMIQRRGYRFVTLEAALEDAAYRLPDRYVGARGPSWIQRWAITRGQEPGVQPPVPEWVSAAARP
ncbi:MAG TPA: polysaccharide deacetylase family protein [Longimicrobium sp.]|jgi:peptidoglycan/xylan/chitin deacetylase (PgdA/CDA1 family)|uniref:polysaccharide deacetylase family protein n=1 Tax=Longimicrobium sp. TaxID=2029185 RepID=UPI002EDBB01F